MGLLGQGTYEAVAQMRGGSPLVDYLRVSSLSFSRRLDEVSAASLQCASGSSFAFATIDAWSHEISVLRNGEEAWVGPIVSVDWEPDFVSIQANDLVFWLERRLLEVDHNFVNVDAGTIFAVLVGDAFARDASPNVSVGASSTGIMASRKIVGAEERRAADVLRELARTAVDFTAIGRSVRCGAQEVPATAAFFLTDSTLLSPKLSSNGTDAATEVVVLGSNVKNKTVTGRAGGTSPDFGLVQQQYSESTIEDNVSAAAAALSRWQFLRVPPLTLTGILAPEAPVDFADLVPGARVRCELVGLDREVADDFRLAQVDVNVRPSDQGLQEEVAVTLEPLGTVIGG